MTGEHYCRKTFKMQALIAVETPTSFPSTEVYGLCFYFNPNICVFPLLFTFVLSHTSPSVKASGVPNSGTSHNGKLVLYIDLGLSQLLKVCF